MKRLLIIMLLLPLTSFRNEDVGFKQPCTAKFDGKAYYYNIDDKKPNLAFQMLFYCEGDSQRAVIVGPEIQSGGRALFFRSIINDLHVIGDSISFNFIEGELYSTAFTLQDYKNYRGQAAVGFSQERLFYKGVVQGDSIIRLRCRNKYYTCSSDSIVFRKR